VNKIESLLFNKFWLILLFLALIKLWLVLGVSLVGFGWGEHDDRLFLNLTNGFLSFLEGSQDKWLGAYNHLMLSKVPLYSIFIATSFLAGFSLLFSQTLLYITSGIFLITSLRKMISSSLVLIVFYAVYIFNPEMVTRVMREGIYPAINILAIAGLINLYIHRNAAIYKLSLWSIFLGIMLSLVWLTREEGILILPFFFTIESYIIFFLYKQFKISQEFFKRTLLCLLLPLILLIGSIHAVSFLNKTYYGVYTIGELQSESFLSAYGSLTRVEISEFKRFVPVLKKARNAIYKISPSFKEIEQFLEGEKIKHWEAISCKLYPSSCGEITGGFFLWALRDAVAMAGYYKYGAIAEQYYFKLAREIDDACDKGLLKCNPKRSTMTPPFRKEYISFILKAFFEGANKLISFKGDAAYWVSPSVHSQGSEESLILFRDLTREDIAPLSVALPPSSITITGWVFAPSKEVKLKIRSTDQKTNISPLSFKKEGGLDVYEHFSRNFSQPYEFAKNSRFTITSPCIKNCELIFYTEENEVLGIINLENTDDRKLLSSSPLYFSIDNINKSEPLPPKQIVLPMQHKLDVIKINLLQKIANVYYTVIPWLSYLGIICYLVSITYLLVFRKLTFLFVLNTAVFGTIILRLLTLSYIHITSFSTILDPRYLSPLYPLLLVFIMLTIIDIVNTIFFNKDTQKVI
jgi:hypothetical protein